MSATIPHGVHLDVPHAAYHAPILGMASKGALDQIARSPAHYRAWLAAHESTPTPAQAMGSAVHCAVLEPDRFAAEYVTEPEFGDCRRKDNKAARDAWREVNAGRTWLTTEDAATVEAIRGAVMAHPIAGRLLTSGQAEVTCRWQDPETGVECRARADYWRPDLGLLIDLKTAADAGAREFGRAVTTHRYHVQDAHYREGWRVAGHAVEHFLFIAVEKTPPYGVAVYGIDSEALERGETLRRRDLDRMAECLRSDDWPSYPAEISPLSLPRWAFYD